MTALALVMPMAGRGSRFAQRGVALPKPLVELHGRPLFWWAVESVRRATPLRELVFVVLAAHVEEFGIDAKLLAAYPSARVVVLPAVTAGAAETAAAGVAALATAGPFAVNDCDHAFDATGLPRLVQTLAAPRAVAIQGALLGFRSTDPAYSYAKLDRHGMVTATVEKQVVSPFAIAGCYLFADVSGFAGLVARYREEGRYAELFVSGLYDLLLREGGRVAFQPLAGHVPFGTPEELARVRPGQLAALGLA